MRECSQSKLSENAAGLTTFPIASTFASSAPAFSAAEIGAEFGTGQLLTAFMITSTFLLGFATGPSVFSSISELYGRKPPYVVGFVLYTVLIIGQPLAKNAATFAITRFLSAFMSSATLSVSPGVLMDIHPPETRGLGLSLFLASLYLGPVMGPIVGESAHSEASRLSPESLTFSSSRAGAYVSVEVNWRWVFWVMLIYAGVCAAIVIFLLPESYAPVILKKRAQRLRKAGDTQAWATHERMNFSLSAGKYSCSGCALVLRADPNVTSRETCHLVPDADLCERAYSHRPDRLHESSVRR